MSETILGPHIPVTLDQAVPVVSDAQPTADTPPERPESQREVVMRAIAEARMRKLAEELSYGEALADDARDVGLGQDIGTSARQRAEAAAAGDATRDVGDQSHQQTSVNGDATQPSTSRGAASAQLAPDTNAQPQRRAVTINGQQFAFTDEELVQLATVGAQATAYAHQLRQQQQSQPTPQPQAVQQQPARTTIASFDQEQALALVRQLSYSPEPEAAGAMQQLYQRARDDAVAEIRSQMPNIDPQQLAHAAAQQASQQLRFEQNLTTIGHEYPDIFNNTRLSQLAALTLHDIRQRDTMLNRQRSELELYREACNEVRGTITPQQPQSATPIAQQQSVQQQPSQAASSTQLATAATRVVRKREAPQQPQAVAQRAPIDSDERRYPTGSQIVEQYRKARGQPGLH